MTHTQHVYHSIAQVDPDQWNQLRWSGGDLFMDPRFISAVERSMAETVRFRHVLLRNGCGRPIASACLSSMNIDFALMANGHAKTAARWVERVSPSLAALKVVFCGLPVSAGQSNLRLAPDHDSRETLATIDALAKQFAQEERAAVIVFKEFEPAQTAQLDALQRFGYRRADSLPMNFVCTKAGDFQEFASHLKSRKRYTIRRSQQKFAASGLRVEQLMGGEGVESIYTDEVHGLYGNVLDRAAVKLERLPATFFRELARLLPGNSVFTFVRDGDRVAGFAASVFAGDTYHQMFVGVDYELNPKCDLYFNLFYNAVDFGLKQGFSQLDIGQTSDTFKRQKLCCRQRPLALYVRATQPASKLILACAFKKLFPTRAADP